MQQLSVEQKLAGYIRRYYQERTLRGLAVLLLLLCSVVLLLVLTEGGLWLPVGLRTAAVMLLSLGTLGYSYWQVLQPALVWWGMRTGMQADDAARTIGRQLPAVQDQLLNYLQLKQMLTANNSLVVAALRSKDQTFAPYDFTSIIDLGDVRRLFGWAAVPVLVWLLLASWQPGWLGAAFERVWHFQTHYNPPPPFEVSWQGLPKSVVAGQDVHGSIALHGDALPAELFLYRKAKSDVRFQRYSMVRRSATRYAFVLNNVREDEEIYAGDGVTGSPAQHLRVLERPAIGLFQITLFYPPYTGLPAEQLPQNVGDFQAIVGTTARFTAQLNGRVQQAALLLLPGARVQMAAGQASFTGNLFVRQSAEYQWYILSIDSVPNADSVRYRIEALADKAPTVQIAKPGLVSSLPANGMLAVRAELKDDYGLSRLLLHYRISKSEDAQRVSDKFQTIDWSASLKQGNEQNVEQVWDVLGLQLTPGDEVEYYLQAWDNDAVSGNKPASSERHRIVYATTETSFKQMEEQTGSFETEMGALQREQRQVQEQLANFQKKLLDKNRLSFDEKRELNKLLDKQKEIQQRLDKAREQLDKTLEQAKDNKTLSPEQEKKLSELQKLMQEMKDPQLQEFLKQMQAKTEKMNNRMLQREMEQLKRSAEDMKRDIERTQALFKQWKADQKLDEILRRLQNLEQRQELLRQRAETARKPEELKQLAEQQKQLEAEMQKLQEELKKLEELKAQTPKADKEELQDMQELGQQTEKEMQQAEQELQQQNKKKAAQRQERAQQMMQQMQKQLQQMQQESEQEQQAENYEDLRQLLDNLLKLSFDQESLRDQITSLRFNDPILVQRMQQQNKLRDDLVMLQDSLEALAQRAMEIKETVMDEAGRIQRSMNDAVELLQERNIGQAAQQQQFVMTGLNNLANMLTDALQQMQNQMKQQGQGQQGKKKNNKGLNMQQMIQLQQMLNKQLQDQMDGKGNPEELAKQAEKQEQIRKQLQEMYRQMMEEGGKGDGSMQKVIEDMEKSEQELLKQQLTAELMLRQQQILNRMLDYDKALREREFEERRASESARPTEQQQGNWQAQDIKERIRREQLVRKRVQYQLFYQQLIDRYYELLNPPKP